jgi:SAM-dependent methyltransferase
LAEINNGLRSILAMPFVYNFFQDLVGARRARREFVAKYVQAAIHENILDIGCGTCEILRYLPDINYYGIDISRDYIEAAKKLYGDKGQFMAEEISESMLKTLPKFDKVIAIGLIHHLNDSEAVELFQVVKLSLRSGGKFIAMDPCLTGDGQSKSAQFMINLDRGRNVRNPVDYKRLASGSFVNATAYLRSDLLNIPYEHIIIVCEKNDTIQ